MDDRRLMLRLRLHGLAAAVKFCIIRAVFSHSFVGVKFDSRRGLMWSACFIMLLWHTSQQRGGI